MKHDSINCIEVSHLNKDFGTFSLKDVSFSLPRGSIMGFIGENGAGKTTTIRCILNLISRDGGEIRLFGRDNIRDEKDVKEDIGVVLDESYFHDNLTTKDISRIMGSIYKNWDDGFFRSLNARFSLPENKIVKDFSKGMKMKLNIAVALAHHPKLLILDEATSGLDPIVRSEILDLFLEFIQEEDHSVLLSSHITSDLEKIADYITFIHDGRIVFSEQTDELRYRYGILRTKQDEFQLVDKEDMIGYRKNQFGYEILVANREATRRKYPQMVIDSTNLEEIMLYMSK